MVSWADRNGSYVEDIRDPRRFRAAIDEADVLVAHNLSFDVHQVRESTGIDLLTIGKPLVDTDLLARIVLPERRFAKNVTDDEDFALGGYKLKDLAKTYLRADAKAAEDAIVKLAETLGIKLKGENATPGGFYEVWRAYPTEMEEYARLDAVYARDLLPILENKLDSKTSGAWALEQKTTPAIIRAEQRGVAVDPEIVAKLKNEYEPIAERAYEAVTRVLGDDALKGNDALREALLSAGIPLYQKTPSGDLATNKIALQEFEDDYPVIANLFEWRNASKFLSTYIDPMTGRTDVHPSFWQMGAWTSRMACSRPNMQNIPARAKDGATPVRAAFVPRSGYCFVVCDYDSIELRMLAYYLNDPDFRQLIANGYDAFAWLAAQLEPHGHPYEYYLKGAPGAKIRGDYKNVTYAICYGAGGKRVSDMLGLNPEPFWDEDHPKIVAARKAGRDWPKVGYQYAEGRKVVSKVKATLPRYDELQRRLRKKVKTTGFVSTLYGHKQVISKDKLYVTLNALIQGGAAGIFKEGIVAAESAVAHLGAYPVLFVHDEIVMECPIPHAEECLPLTQQAMAGAYDLDPALVVSGSIAYNNYAEAK